MYKKVTYLVSAGASIGTLPLVKDISEFLRNFKSILVPRFGKVRAKDEEEFYIHQGNIKSKFECYEEMKKAVLELVKVLPNVASFDTLAKRIAIKEDYKELTNIIAILTASIIFEQATNLGWVEKIRTRSSWIGALIHSDQSSIQSDFHAQCCNF